MPNEMMLCFLCLIVGLGEALKGARWKKFINLSNK